MALRTAPWSAWFARSPEASLRLRLLIGCLFLSTILWLPTVRAEEGVPQHLASMAKELFVQSKAGLTKDTGDPDQDAVRRRARKILKDSGVRYWAREEVRADIRNGKTRKHTMTVGDNDDQLEFDWDPEKNRFKIRIRANETSEGADDRFSLQLNGDVLSTPAASGDDTYMVLSVRPSDSAISVLTDEELRALQGTVFGKWRSGDGNVWEISDPNRRGKAKPPPPAPKNDENPKVGKDSAGDKKKDDYKKQRGNSVPDPFNKTGPKIDKSLVELHQEHKDRSEGDFNQAQESIHGKKRPAEETDAYQSLRNRRDRVGGKIKSLEREYSGRIKDASRANDGLKKSLKNIKETPENPKGKQEQNIIEKALKGDLSKQEKKKLNELRTLIDWINRLRDARATLDDMQELLEVTGSIYADMAPQQDRGGKSEQTSERSGDRIAEYERQIERIRSDRVYRWTNTVTGEVVLQDEFKKLKKPFVYFRNDPNHLREEADIARLKEKINEIRATNEPLPVVEHDPIGMDEIPASGKSQSLNIRVTDKNGYSWTYDKAMLSDGRIKASRTLRNVKDSPRVPKQLMRQAIASFSPPEWVELDVRVEGETRKVYMSGQLWRMQYTYDGLSQIMEGIHTPFSRDLRLIRDKPIDVTPKLSFLRIDETRLVPVAPETRLQYGAMFVVEARYGSPQDGGTRDLTLDWGGNPLVLKITRQGDGRVYRSERLLLMPPAKKSP